MRLYRSSEVIQPIYHEWQDDDDTKLEEETERGKQDDHFGEVYGLATHSSLTMK